MTAEVAILNGSGVALAADSAVTVGTGRSSKVYNTVNKLFGLSRYHPVGVMIFGNAEMAGLPWEPIIKSYRNELDAQRKDTIEEYAVDFMEFLDSKAGTYYPASVQRHFVVQRVKAAFQQIAKDCQEAGIARVRKNPSTTADQTAIAGDIAQTVARHHADLAEMPFVKDMDEARTEEIRTEYKDAIDKAVTELFPIPVPQVVKDQMVQLAGWFVTKLYESPSHTGVVIAGYGDNEMFPSLVALEITGVLNNHVLHVRSDGSSVNHLEKANLLAFAQPDMVVAFMNGIEDRVREHIDGRIHDLAHSIYPQLVTKAATECGLPEQQAQALAEAVREAGQGVVEQFGVGLTAFVRHKVGRPIIQAVANLPKEELGAMAESLVNLTSLRRHVGPELDTVGGPVDVAVISKGDGFVWLRRKHYFSAQLNPHFLAGYYRNDAGERGGLNGPSQQDPAQAAAGEAGE